MKARLKFLQRKETIGSASRGAKGLRSSRIKLSPGEYLLLISASAVLGILSMLLASGSDGKLTSLLLLPGSLILIFSFLLAGRYLGDAILIFRASIDLLLNQTRVAGGGVGLGAAINFVVVLSGLRSLFSKDKKMRDGVFIWIPFLIFLFLSLLNAPDKIAALKSFVAFLTCVAAYITGRGAALNNSFLRVMFLTVAGSAIAFCVSMGYLAVGKGYLPESDGGLRFAGIFGHPNILAFFCVINSAIMLYLEESKCVSSWKLMALLRVHLAFTLILLLATRTRSAWAAEAVLYFGYALFFKRRYFIYIALSLLVALAVPGVQDRVIGVFSSGATHSGAVGNSYDWRLMLWRDALGSLSAIQFVTGRGLSSFYYYCSSFFSLSGGLRWGAHSIFVQLIYELGVFGLLAFVFILIKCFFVFLSAFKKGLVRPEATIGLFLVLMYVFVGYSDNMFDYVAFNYYFYSLLGALMGKACLANKSDNG